MIDSVINPAEIAAKEALNKIHFCIDNRKSFRLEAGAGAGKTFSLIKALEYLIKIKGSSLIKQNQQIACITYTNVACDEIKQRIDGHPSVYVSTIHAFCWSMIKDFQPYLRLELSNIGKWTEKFAETGEVLGLQKVLYENGYREIGPDYISIHHDDVLSLFIKLMERPKFRSIFTGKYPILLIDEYQDTDKLITNALKKYFLDNNVGPFIGFFGDHWQKIYGTGCGKLEHVNLDLIDKGANFRSDQIIIECLNRIRPELPQQGRINDSEGFVGVYLTNNWIGTRRTGQHWDGDLPPNNAHDYLERLKRELIRNGWDFSNDKTKILMLTHKVLATEQGYKNIADIFPYNESYIKKEDPYIAFFADILEPVCLAYQEKHYGEMFAILGSKKQTIKNLSDKSSWIKSMEKLLELRTSGKIGDVLDLLMQSKRPRLSENVEQREIDYKKNEHNVEVEDSSITFLKKFRDIPYSEIISLVKFIEEKTPFSTKHGVKGAEFENVLVVFGRGWNLYNFNNFLEYVQTGIPLDKIDFFERNRNLFYVAVSRPKKRLALLFTQKLSDNAVITLKNWFGENAIRFLGD